jgi:hypothetical protein
LLQLPLLSIYCRVEIGPFLNGQRVNAKDPADGKASLVKCFTLYGSPHSIPTYKMALMMRRSDQPFRSAR